MVKRQGPLSSRVVRKSPAFSRNGEGQMAKYSKYSLGQIEALMNVIGGEEVVDGILNRTVTFVKNVER